MTSPKGTLNKTDWKKIGNNALLFFAPVFLLYLTSVASAINIDGLSVSDFYASDAVVNFFVLYLINVAIDFLKKLSAGSAK